MMIRAILRNAGFHPKRLIRAIQGWFRYKNDMAAFRRGLDTAAFRWGREQPMLTEWNDASGSLGAYFFQDQLVARWILDANPERHLDVGSRLDGFIGSLSVFREVDVIDIRPQTTQVRNVRFHQLDLMNPLPAGWKECTDSLSCLHTIEHFGLGRYGDPVDPAGHLKGLSQMKDMVRPGGRIYLSTPMGPQRVEFNAHRVFSCETILGWFGEGWTIERFAVIDDAGILHEDVDWRGNEAADHFGCNLGVGIIAARKSQENLQPVRIPAPR